MPGTSPGCGMTPRSYPTTAHRPATIRYGATSGTSFTPRPGTSRRKSGRLKRAGGWEGKTIEAAYDNAIQSVHEPFYTGTAALRAAELTHKWREVVQFVLDKLISDPGGEYDSLKARYNHDIEWKSVEYNGGENGVITRDEHTTEGDKATVNKQYDEYMQRVMEKSYAPSTESIWNHYPQFVASNASEKPTEIPGLPQPPSKPTNKPIGTPSGGGGGTPSFGGGSPSLGGGGMSIPKTPGPSLPDGLKDQSQRLPRDVTTPSQSTDSPVTDPSQAMGPASGLASGAGQALGAATQAAKASPGGPPKSMGPKPKMPEGALQLGKGARGSGVGGTGGGKGGASLGGLPKGLPSGLPGQPAAATQAAAAGSQPGAGAGASGMGPPGTPGGAGHGAGGGTTRKRAQSQQGAAEPQDRSRNRRRRRSRCAGDRSGPR